MGARALTSVWLCLLHGCAASRARGAQRQRLSADGGHTVFEGLWCAHTIVCDVHVAREPLPQLTNPPVDFVSPALHRDGACSRTCAVVSTLAGIALGLGHPGRDDT